MHFQSDLSLDSKITNVTQISIEKPVLYQILKKTYNSFTYVILTFQDYSSRQTTPITALENYVQEPNYIVENNK